MFVAPMPETSTTHGTVPCRACGGPAAPTAELDPVALYRCSVCGFLFERERSADEVHGLYDQSYFDTYAGTGSYEDDAQRRHEAALRLRLVQRYVKGGRMLELGSAMGYFLAAAARGGFTPVGIEPGEEAARRARERSGVEVIGGFVEDAPLPERSFDVACAWHVLEHVAEPLAALARVRDALIPRGLLVVEVPNVESVLARRTGSAWAHLQPQHHVGQYAPRSLRALLEHSGFVVEHMDTASVFGYYRLARRLRPTMVAAHVRESLGMGVPPFRPHPRKHELLRAVARAAS
jgi:SAM-dependent methyltransferase